MLNFFKTFFILVFLIFGPISCSVPAKHAASQVSAQKPVVAKHHLWEYKRDHFNLYSLNSEVRLGELIQEKQIETFRKKNLAVNPKSFQNIRQRIQTIAKKLAQVSDHPEFSYEVTIFEKPDVVNAFCLPGGKIGVFTGLFDPQKGLVNPQNNDELAAVLGHEMAHATLRHVTRRLTTMNGIGFLSSLIGQGVGESWRDVFYQVVQTGTTLYFPSYSRKHEEEADQVGLYYLVRAGFDPKAAVRIWGRAAQGNSKKQDDSSFFATHPSSGHRAKTLQAYLPDADLVRKREAMLDRAKRE